MRERLADISKTLTEVSGEAAELPSGDRLKLARILLDLTEPNAAPDDDEVEAALAAEIGRRLEELRSGAVDGVPLAEVRRRIEARLAS